jgi:hypothetical protein
MAAESSFAPANSTFLAVSPTSANVAIPSGGTILAVTNLGIYPAFVAIGTAGTLAATAPNHMPILPDTQVFLTIGADTTLAAVTLQQLTGLNLTSGN